MVTIKIKGCSKKLLEDLNDCLYGYTNFMTNDSITLDCIDDYIIDYPKDCIIIFKCTVNYRVEAYIRFNEVSEVWLLKNGHYLSRIY